MASISYDGQSLILDGRRVWLVSGTMHYARVPRADWRDRVRAARQAGLNCLEVVVCWSLHEPEPGTFDFDGEVDLRAFVEILRDEGLYCILRPGPYVGDGCDLGGMPGWLLETPDIQLRQNHPQFVQAAARFLDRVMEEVRDLQVTEEKPGPIVLVQNEHQWFCHRPEQAETYLVQISRFLRESGCEVPLVNRNNLWQQVQGTIDTWSGDNEAFGNCRQLRTVQTDAPCIISSLPAGQYDVWQEPAPTPRSAEDIALSMARISATGSMFNLDPFCGGTNFGFRGGRLGGGDHRFVTHSADAHCPVSETGQRTPTYRRIKRLATFLSQFGSLMANLRPDEHHTVASNQLSVVQQSGMQGHVVFLLRPPEQASPQSLTLTTPDGQLLPVHLGEDPCAWLVLGAVLEGKLVLDVTNLRPWAYLGSNLLVLFGPAGTEGLVSLDGSLISVEVPKGKDPLVMPLDQATLVILNETQVDAAVIGDDGLHLGVAGLDEHDEPIRHPDFGSHWHIDLKGEVKKRRRKPDAPRKGVDLGRWRCASLTRYVQGTAPRYAMLEQPRSLESCGADYGYGWYRVRVDRPRAGSANLLIPDSGDRLNLYVESTLRHVIGVGAGAENGPVDFQMPAGTCDLVFLADNLGRFSDDVDLHRPKGLFGDLLDVKPQKLSKPRLTHEPRIDPFELTSYIPHCADDNRDTYPRYTYDVDLPSKQPLILMIRGDRPRSVIVVNGHSVGLDHGRQVTCTIRLEEHLRKGVNRLTFALIDPGPEAGKGSDFTDHLTLYRIEENLSAKARWYYARWELPHADAYGPLTEAQKGQPASYRTHFEAGPGIGPLHLQLNGMSKGQVYLNGRNLGRYFVSSHAGKAIGPHNQCLVPASWLREAEPNELILFDEYGRPPSRCKLVPAD